MIRCSKDGEHRRINSGQHLAKKYWDFKKQQAKKSYPNHAELNKTLIHIQQEMEEVYLKLSRTGTTELTLIDVVKQFGKPKSINFFDLRMKDYFNNWQVWLLPGQYSLSSSESQLNL